MPASSSCSTCRRRGSFAAFLTALFSAAWAHAAPVITAVEYQVIPAEVSQVMSGSGLADVQSVALLSRNLITSGTFQPVSDSQMTVTLPLIPLNRDAFLRVQSASGTVIAFDPASPACRLIPPDADVTVTGASPYELVYVRAGGKLRLSGSVSGFAIVAETGAEVDWTGISGVSGMSLTYNAGTIITGLLPPVIAVRRYLVSTLSASHAVGGFRLGYPLHLTVTGSGTITTTPDRPYFATGETIELVATPAAGLVFGGWTGAVVSNEPTVSLPMGTSALTIGANFTGVPLWSLALTAGPGGSVTASPAKELYVTGEVVTLSAEPDAIHYFEGWSGDATGAAPVTTVTMDGDKSASASFSRLGTAAAIRVDSVDHLVIPNGLPVTLTGSGFSQVTKAGFQSVHGYLPAIFAIVDDSTLQVTMPAQATSVRLHHLILDSDAGTVVCAETSHPRVKVIRPGETYTPSFSDSFEIIHALPGSTLEFDEDLSAGAVYAESGSIVDFPDDGFVFLSAFVYTPGTTILGSLPDPIFGNATRLVPAVSLNPGPGLFRTGHPIHFTVIGNGSVSTVPATKYFPAFEWVELAAVAGPGAVFQGWSGSLASTSPTASMRVEAQALNITATFAGGVTLTRHVSAGGTVTVSPDKETFLEGETVILTANPAPGQQFAGWGLDANGNGLSTSLTMSGNKTISAVFRDPSAPQGPRITAADHLVMAKGGTITLTGTDLAGPTAATFVGVSGATSAAFQPVDAGTLQVTMPNFRNEFWSNVLLLETATGSTVALDPAESGVLMVESGQSAVVDSSNPIQLVYVAAGAMLRVHGFTAGLHVFAEDGAIVDWSGVTSADNCDFVHSPGTIVLGDPEALNAEEPIFHQSLRIRQVASLGLSRAVGSFRVGQPIHFTIVGNGSVTTDSATTYIPLFTWVNLTAVAGEGAYFQGWSGAVVSSSAQASVRVENQPLNITATFLDGWTINRYASHAGAITLSPDKATYQNDEVVTLTAAPAPGHEFVGWGLDAAGAALSVNLTMDGNKSVSAVFRDTSAPPGPRITAADRAVVPEGGTISLSGTELAQVTSASFLGLWTHVDADFHEMTASSLQVTMPGFDRQDRPYQLLIETTTGSTVTVDPAESGVLVVESGESAVLGEFGLTSSVHVKAGAMLQLHGFQRGMNVFAEDGAIIDWSGVDQADDCNFVHSPHTIILGAPEELVDEGHLSFRAGLRIRQVTRLSFSSPFAHFRIGYPLTVAAKGPGQVAVQPLRDHYTAGEFVTLTANPAAGMHFIRWSGDLSSRDPVATLRMDHDSTVTALFSAQALTFSAWRLAHFTTAELSNPAISGPSADPDGDSLSNAAEYAFSTDPRTRSADHPVQITARPNPGNSDRPVSILVSYVRPTSAADVEYTLKVSAEGAVWHFNGDGTGIRYSAELGVDDLGEGLERVNIELFPDSAPPASQMVRIDAQLY